MIASCAESSGARHPRGGRRNAWTAAVLVAALAALPAGLVTRPAFADEPDAAAKQAQTVIDAIRAGDTAAAAALLTEEPDAAALASRADLVHVLCDRAYRYDHATTDAAPRRALATRLFALATAALQAAPTDDRARWALAEALVLRERAGPRTGPAAWTQAAELLEKVHARKPADALPLAYSVGFLLEGACNEPDSTVVLCKRADATAATALASQQGSPTLGVTLATSQLWAARTLLATNRKVARTQVRSAFATLEPFAAGEPPVLDAATLWNDTLSFAKRSGFVMDEKFVVATQTTLDGTFAFDLPLSSKWKFDRVEAAGDQPAYDYVTELSESGARVRQLLFRRYVWSMRYTFEDTNAVGGDNVKSIAQGLQSMIATRVLAPGASVPAPDRRPFNRDLDGFVFKASGRTAPEPGAKSPGSALRVTGYVMRGHKQACYAVLVYDHSAQEDPSPEIEMILASLREPDR